MNNKGYAVTAIVYTAVILLSLVMFAVLEIEKNKYEAEKKHVEDVNHNLSVCLESGDC